MGGNQINNGNGDVCNLFMDYETFGDWTKWADTGIYMAFNWHIPFLTSRRLHPAGEVMLGRIAYGIAVLPFMAETSR